MEKNKELTEKYKESCLTEVYRDGIRKGKQEQQEVSYTEEEVLNIILKYELAKRNKGIYWSDREVKEWLEQFKKINNE